MKHKNEDMLFEDVMMYYQMSQQHIDAPVHKEFMVDVTALMKKYTENELPEDADEMQKKSDIALKALISAWSSLMMLYVCGFSLVGNQVMVNLLRDLCDKFGIGNTELHEHLASLD